MTGKFERNKASRAALPPVWNAIIAPAQKDNRIEVRVQFTRPISFPGYTYNYDFDYTAKSGAFLTK